MKTNRLKKGLFGLMLSLIAICTIGQVSFADDIRNVSSGVNQGGVASGMGRIKISDADVDADVDAGLKNSIKVFDATFAAAAPTPKVRPKVLLYATFTSGTETSMSGMDLPAFSPILDKNSAYMYLAFRVTKETTVNINWLIRGPTTIKHRETGFEDPVDGGPLQPGFWYFAWFKLDPEALIKGTYTFKGTVKPTKTSGAKSNSCQFQIEQ